MSGYIFSVIAVVPAANAANARKMLRGIGVESADDLKSVDVKLSPSGNPPATHYGCHWWERQEVVDIITNAQNDIYPTGIVWSNFNITAGQAKTAFNAMTWDVSEDLSDVRERARALLLASGLRIV
jgi:hypothetical protein